MTVIGHPELNHQTSVYRKKITVSVCVCEWTKKTKETKLLTKVVTPGNRIWDNSDGRKKCKESEMTFYFICLNLQ